jgi:hypothetical protein
VKCSKHWKDAEAWSRARRTFRGDLAVPAIRVIVTAYRLVDTLVAPPSRALVGVGLNAAGLSVYAQFTRCRDDDTGAWLWPDED